MVRSAHTGLLVTDQSGTLIETARLHARAQRGSGRPGSPVGDDADADRNVITASARYSDRRTEEVASKLPSTPGAIAEPLTHRARSDRALFVLDQSGRR